MRPCGVCAVQKDGRVNLCFSELLSHAAIDSKKLIIWRKIVRTRSILNTSGFMSTCLPIHVF